MKGGPLREAHVSYLNAFMYLFMCVHRVRVSFHSTLILCSQFPMTCLDPPPPRCELTDYRSGLPPPTPCVGQKMAT